MEALRVIVPQALLMVTPEKVRQYFNNCFKICSLYAGGMSLTEWLSYDQGRKNLNKRVVRYSNLLKKGKDCEKKMCSVLEELKSYNEMKKSYHRDFSVKIEKLVQVCTI